MSVSSLKLSSVPSIYRSPWWGEIDAKFQKTLSASSLAGLLLLVLAFVVPQAQQEMRTLEDVPERFARLMVESKPAPSVNVQTPVAADPAPAVEDQVEQKPLQAEIEEPHREPAAVQRRGQTEPKDVAGGSAGRDMAEEQIGSQLIAAAASLEKTLTSVQTSLKSTSTTKSSPRVRRKAADKPGTKGSEDLGKADIKAAGEAGSTWGSSVGTIEVISTSSGAQSIGGGRRKSTGAGSAGAGGLTDAQLLAVVRKNAAGIEYCFDRALKHDTRAQGKMVVAITVAPGGSVSKAVMVSDSVGSAEMSGCVVSQIQGWRFPKASRSTTFHAPFVFSPQN